MHGTWFLIVSSDYKLFRSTAETAASQSNHDPCSGGIYGSTDTYYTSKTRVYQCSVMSKSLRNWDIYGVYSDICILIVIDISING